MDESGHQSPQAGGTIGLVGLVLGVVYWFFWLPISLLAGVAIAFAPAWLIFRSLDSWMDKLGELALWTALASVVLWIMFGVGLASWLGGRLARKLRLGGLRWWVPATVASALWLGMTAYGYRAPEEPVAFTLGPVGDRIGNLSGYVVFWIVPALAGALLGVRGAVAARRSRDDETETPTSAVPIEQAHRADNAPHAQ